MICKVFFVFGVIQIEVIESKFHTPYSGPVFDGLKIDRDLAGLGCIILFSILYSLCFQTL